MLFAIENRERLIGEYFEKKEARAPKIKLYDLLNEYYKKDSQYMRFDASRGRILTDSTRVRCHSTIIKSFIPYLQSQKVAHFYQIDTPFLTRYQDYLLEKGGSSLKQVGNSNFKPAASR